LAEYSGSLCIANKVLVCLQMFFHDLEQRVEDADMLQQTLRTQLSAETERALSSEARVVTLDLHLKESRAKVAKLAVQVEDLEQEQVCVLCMLVVDMSADRSQHVVSE